VQETRRARLEAVIQEELSTVVPREIRDPRVPPLSFSRVEVTQDGGQATVWFALLRHFGVQDDAPDRGDEAIAPLEDPVERKRAEECVEGLKSASGFLRRHLAKILNTRIVPTLIFKEDRGLENTMRVNELLKKI
jgi:ribosome-binding factor A